MIFIHSISIIQPDFRKKKKGRVSRYRCDVTGLRFVEIYWGDLSVAARFPIVTCHIQC